jgi:DNA transposition AAA+ family ATPase
MTRQLSEAITDGLRGEIKQFLRSRPDVAFIDLVHHTTLSESTGRNFLSGHCPGGREVVAELRKALDHARAGDILQPGERSAVVVTENQTARPKRVVKTHSFYETQTVKRVGEVLSYCAENAAIGVVTADFGVGKTESVAAWRRGRGRNVESLVFEFDEFSSSNKVDFVACLARMMGIPAFPGTQGAPTNFRNICAYLRENPTLCAFDQCETVRPRIFQIIRQIWDRTTDAGVGVVILAAPVLLARLSRSGMTDLGALTSRVGIWAPLSGTTKAEMAAIVRQEGVTDVTDAAFDLWWKSTAGSMRRLMRSLDLVKSRHSGKRVTETTIAGVAGHLWGMNMEAA